MKSRVRNGSAFFVYFNLVIIDSLISLFGIRVKDIRTSALPIYEKVKILFIMK